MAGEDGGSSNGNVGCIDIISGLPDEIRECILGYLPISDAVRTSVLSHKWRYSWRRATRLNIRLDAHMEDDMDFTPAMYCALVGRILLYHIGPIHMFVVHVTWRGREEDMNSWLQFVSRNGIQDLRLLCPEGCYDFDIPHSIFQCHGLSCLTLDKGNLKYSLPFRGFPNLVRLVLYDLEVYGDVLEKIISSSLTLDVLIIERCCFRSDGRSETTAISAPNLRVLRVVCCFFGLSYIYLKHTPNLMVASFTIEEHFDPDLTQSNCFDVLRSMPKIEVLTFQCLLQKTSPSDVILKRLPELLVNLKTVTLDEMDVISVDEMSFMFCIIRSSPNLQTLDIIVLSRCIYFININILLPYLFTAFILSKVLHCLFLLALQPSFANNNSVCKDSLAAATSYLDDVAEEEIKANIKTISVRDRFSRKREHFGAQTALIGSVVSCFPTLEKLIIKTFGNIQRAEKLRISRALRRFGRSSSKPKIIYEPRKYRGFHFQVNNVP